MLGSLGVVGDAGITNVNVWSILLINRCCYCYRCCCRAVGAALPAALQLVSCSSSPAAACQPGWTASSKVSDSYQLALCRELCCKASQTVCLAEQLQTREVNSFQLYGRSRWRIGGGWLYQKQQGTVCTVGARTGVQLFARGLCLLLLGLRLCCYVAAASGRGGSTLYKRPPPLVCDRARGVSRSGRWRRAFGERPGCVPPVTASLLGARR